MTDQERDALLQSIADTQSEHGEILREHGEKLDALSDQLQDVARAVRELGGDVIDHPSEATG